MPRAIVLRAASLGIIGEFLARRAQSVDRMHRLRKLIYLEFELLECCRHLIERDGVESAAAATLLYLQGTAQQHIFALGTYMRNLGEPPVSYSVCVHKTLFSRRGIGEILMRLEDRYQQSFARAGSEQLAQLLRANLQDLRPAATARVSVRARPLLAASGE